MSLQREDSRSKKIIFVSSCLLNTNNKVRDLARYGGFSLDVVKILHKYDLGMQQMELPRDALPRHPALAAHQEPLRQRRLPPLLPPNRGAQRRLHGELRADGLPDGGGALLQRLPRPAASR